MKLTRKFLSIIALLLSLIMLFTSCEIFNDSTTNPPEQEQGGQNETITIPGVNSKGEFDLACVPEPDYTSSDFDGYVVINNNVPFFTNDEKATDTCFERYSELDSLGRVGVAFSCICKITVPTEGRGDISYKPTGWVQGSYSTSLVPGQYLYNRSHLIAWSLAGENDNAKNLATGTQYMNQRTMQIFENQILNYIKTNNVANDNRVLYRVTPVFNGNNLLCSGVLMEAYSLNDSGEDIQFCVFVYNIQIGIYLDYATGENRLANESDSPYYGTGSGLAGAKEDVNNGNNKEEPEVIPVPVGNYIISAENSDGTIYFNGSIDDGRFTASNNQNEAVEVTVSTVEGGFVLSFVSGNTVKYIVMNDAAQGAAFTTKASEASVFEWNSSLNTYMVADDANSRAFGTDKSKSYLNLSPYDASSSTNIGKYSWGVFTKIGDAPNPDQGENQNPGGNNGNQGSTNPDQGGNGNDSVVLSEYNHILSKNDFSSNNSTATLSGLKWTLNSNSTYIGTDSAGRGVQFGKAADPNSTMTLKSETIQNVKKIVINTSGASDIKGTLTVSVGDTVVKTITLTKDATDYTIELDAAMTGEILFTYTQTSSKAIYIKSISIYAEQ